MIPPFDHNNVLPPYVGATPTSMASQSPYFKTKQYVQTFFKETD